MAKIDGVSGAPVAGWARRSGLGFSVSHPDRAPPVIPVAAAMPVIGLLHVGSVSTDAATARQVATALDVLARWQATLLGGERAATVSALSRLTACPACADAGLAAAARAVALRARLELARLDAARARLDRQSRVEEPLPG